MPEFASDLLDRLEGGMIDLALLALPVTGSNFLSQEVLRERLCVVHLEQVEKDPFLLLKEGHCFRDKTLSACGRARLDPNVVFESGRFTTILAMVAAGTGVSVVPQMAVESRPGCRFIPLADKGAFRRVGIVQLKQHFRRRAHHAFLKHIQQPASAKTRDEDERIA
jgi:LysR family hydrogen peroxide-inducible transcriptional activator